MYTKARGGGDDVKKSKNINKIILEDPLIVYRDSKLTKLLADSLAGNGVTLMVRSSSHLSLYTYITYFVNHILYISFHTTTVLF